MENDKTEWSVYEANVQSYRNFFISSQTFLLAVGAILLDKSSFLLVLVALIGVIEIWYIWFRVVAARIYIVDYYKFSFDDLYDNSGQPLKEGNEKLHYSTYCSNQKLRKKVNQQFTNHKGWNRSDKFRNFRLTRIKIDIILPVLFTLVWAAFGVYTIATML